MPAHATVREVAVHISNHTMRRGDRGVVVIGGSLELGDIASHAASGVSPTVKHFFFLGFRFFE